MTDQKNGFRKLASILGLSADAPPIVPGAKVIPGREFRYLSFAGADPEAWYEKVVYAVSPPIPTDGSAMFEACTIALPSGETFFGLSYKGDLEGWRSQIDAGAKAHGLRVAQISDGSFLMDNGEVEDLSSCIIEMNG